MARRMTTRAVDREEASNYLTKAAELMRAADKCMESGLWNACVVNCIHCGISSADALTVHYLGLRSASGNHADTVSLLTRTGIRADELKKSSQQLSFLLSIKTVAEYEERLMYRSDAENALKACRRFHGWVEEKVQGK